MNRPVWGMAGAVACWVYAAVWAATWWWSELPPVLTVIEPIVGQRTHSLIPAVMAGLILFGCAPFVRETERIKRIFYAIAIVALVAPALWLAATAQVAAGAMVLWLAIPLAIALWVLVGGKTLPWTEDAAD